MEDTLRDRYVCWRSIKREVLILVLMEDTLSVIKLYQLNKNIPVLILVLMEDTLREQDIRILYISGISIYKPKQIGFC